jgi:hypothetical protein
VSKESYDSYEIWKKENRIENILVKMNKKIAEKMDITP